MIIKNEKQKDTLLAAGKRLREVLDAVSKQVVAGVSTKDLDKVAYTMIIEGGDTPAFLNYKPAGASHPFPATLCVSVNDEMVHGVPGERVIKDGDIVSIDCGLSREGMFVDAARTIIVGEGNTATKNLVEATRKALANALIIARAGARVGDIGNAIERVAEECGCTVIPELGGHGLGAAQHEDPFVPNIGNPGEGEELSEGEVVAIEPILSEGDDPRIKLGDDGFAYCTVDGSRAAHFEHTLMITTGTPIIATGPMW